MSRIEAIRHLLDQDPNDPDLYLMLATELRKEDRHAEAAEALRKHLELMPPTADVGAAYRDLGICLEKQGQADAARETYRQGIEAAKRFNHMGLQSEIEGLLEDV